jgi:hypothetical protein
MNQPLSLDISREYTLDSNRHASSSVPCKGYVTLLVAEIALKRDFTLLVCHSTVSPFSSITVPPDVRSPDQTSLIKHSLQVADFLSGPSFDWLYRKNSSYLTQFFSFTLVP